MIKAKLTTSSLVIYTTCDTVQDNIRTRLDEYGNVNKTKTIGQRGRMLVKRYSRLLSQAIYERRTKEQVMRKQYSNQVNFITLTLPSKQNHTDKEIYRTCLMPFLEEAKKRNIFNNFVWRAEIQKNGNLHYHILADGLPNWSIIRELWNRNTEKLGYVSEYSKKMQSMTYDQYYSMRMKNANTKPELIYKAWEEGNKCCWTNPNSTDLQVVQSMEGLEGYLSKYLAKECEEDSRILDGRHWGCNDAVRKLVDTVTEIEPKELMCVKNAVKSLEIKEIDYEYAMIYVGSHADLEKICDVFIDRIWAIIDSNCNYLYGKFASQMHTIGSKKQQIAENFDYEFLEAMSK